MFHNTYLLSKRAYSSTSTVSNQGSNESELPNSSEISRNFALPKKIESTYLQFLKSCCACDLEIFINSKEIKCRKVKRLWKKKDSGMGDNLSKNVK